MLEEAEIVIDGLQYSNWSETIFRQLRHAGVTAVHATIARGLCRRPAWEFGQP